ncbi:mCG147711 [Mus musculus]|nr:mCG147711 [Mus musculus]
MVSRHYELEVSEVLTSDPGSFRAAGTASGGEKKKVSQYLERVTCSSAAPFSRVSAKPYKQRTLHSLSQQVLDQFPSTSVLSNPAPASCDRSILVLCPAMESRQPVIVSAPISAYQAKYLLPHPDSFQRPTLWTQTQQRQKRPAVSILVVLSHLQTLSYTPTHFPSCDVHAAME